MRWRALAAFATLAVIAVATAPWLAGRWTPGRSTYRVQGIDVSHHQGVIDWARLPGQGVDFAYIKATEGGDWRDPAFARNWRGAGAAGVAHGGYHFYNPCRSGRDQAANFIAVVPSMADALPPVVDLEAMQPCNPAIAPDALQTELAVFLRVVGGHYRQSVVLYLTPEFDEAYRISEAFPRPLWLRSLVRQPRFGARRWSIWQASNFRRLDGIEGRVDWNVVDGRLPS